MTRYEHISTSYIDLVTHKWSRISVDGEPHKWSFVRDGEEKETVSLVVKKDGGLTAELKCGLKDLIVLKTSGSAFDKFWRDELTTLVGTYSLLYTLIPRGPGPPVLHIRDGRVHYPSAVEHKVDAGRRGRDRCCDRFPRYRE